MPRAQTASYGSWSSPITSDLIVASTIGLSGILVDGSDVYWLESRPQEGGRSVIVRSAADGSSVDVTPPVSAAGEAVFNVRSRVHEYGGGAYLVSNGVVYFCNDPDQRLYRQEPGAAPVAITPAAARPRGLRYADGVMDTGRGRMIWVREDHTTGAPEPVNTLVEIPLDQSRPERVVQSGRDFYAAPRLSPDGSRLAWLEWGHPNMPWIGCELWVAECAAADGLVGCKRLIAGGDDESIFQPEWSPDGALYFVSDRAQAGLDGRWWNLFRVRGDPLDISALVEPICPLAAEFGRAQWQFRMSTFAFTSASQLVCSYVQDAVHRMSAVDLTSLETRPIAAEYEDISSLRATAERVYFAGGSPTKPPAVVELHLASCRAEVLKLSTTEDVEAYRKYLSVPEPVTFDTDNGLQAHGLFYPPQNADFAAPGELPPLLVHCHGGPTSAASSTLSWGTQYWTSRGFAVLDVNYGGSTGYGREYRLRLQRNWGVVDVADCVNGARFLAVTKRVHPEQWAISGASAGGYTTLATLTFRKEFKTGASYYGISDLEALTKDTHKFESRYLDGLIGPYPQRQDIYIARSPIHNTRMLGVPIAFFQGAEDMVVPPQQAEAMVEALRRRRIPFLYLLFDGEQHGFRRADNIKRALDAELYFYATFLTDQKLEFRVS
jgi:dienelactone hydrolase